MADGTGDSSTSGRGLLDSAGCCIFCLPGGCQVNMEITIMVVRLAHSIGKSQFSHLLLELLQHQLLASIPVAKKMDVNGPLAMISPVLGRLIALLHELLHLRLHKVVDQLLRLHVVGRLGLTGLVGQLLTEHGRKEAGFNDVQ